MREADWTKVLGWPGYRVYRHEIEEQAKRLKLWVRRKRGTRKLVCSGCGRKLADAEAKVSHGGEQSGNGWTAVVRAGTEESDPLGSSEHQQEAADLRVRRNPGMQILSMVLGKTLLREVLREPLKHFGIGRDFTSGFASHCETPGL